MLRARPSSTCSSAASISATRSVSLVTVPGQHPELGGQLGGVDEVAVVAERELAVADAAEHRLGVAPRARAGGRVAGVADGEVAGERGQRAVVEHVGHEAHVLDDGDVLAVADRHARRLLAPVLQGVEAEVGQVGDRLARGVHAEDAARLLRRVVPVSGAAAHGPHDRTPTRPFHHSPDQRVARHDHGVAQPWVTPAPSAAGRRSRQASTTSSSARSSSAVDRRSGRRRPAPRSADLDAERAGSGPHLGQRGRREPTAGPARRLHEQLVGAGTSTCGAHPAPRPPSRPAPRPRPPVATSCTPDTTPSPTRPRTSAATAVWAAVSRPGRSPPRCSWRQAHAEPASDAARRHRPDLEHPVTGDQDGPRRAAVEPVDQAEHADHRRRVDVGARRLVVEAHVAADDRQARRPGRRRPGRRSPRSAAT